MQNIAWSRMVSSTQFPNIPNLRKGIVTHSTIDNNDGRQETMTGKGNTHDTNRTVFQLPTIDEESIPTLYDEHSENSPVSENDMTDLGKEVPPCYIDKKVGPPLFPKYKRVNDSNLLDDCLKRDVTWSVAGALPLSFEDEDVTPLGSWTSFNKLTTSKETLRYVQEYLPVISSTPEYPVCKQYLDFLFELMDDLEITHVFVHADAKLCHILWKNQDLYKCVVILMGGFHQLRVRQWLLYKRL